MMKREKQALRAAVRAAFPGAEIRDLESAGICAHVLAWPVYRRARVVAGFMPLAREADITPVLRDALAAGKTLLLPRVEGERAMSLRRVERLDALAPGRWGLLEPPEEAEAVPAGAAELLLVPLEAVDPQGMRLGKGGGYYDTMLEAAGGVTLGAALSWQRVPRVPAEGWDRPLDALAAADGIHILNRELKRYGEEEKDG